MQIDNEQVQILLENWQPILERLADILDAFVEDDVAHGRPYDEAEAARLREAYEFEYPELGRAVALFWLERRAGLVTARFETVA